MSKKRPVSTAARTGSECQEKGEAAPCWSLEGKHQNRSGSHSPEHCSSSLTVQLHSDTHLFLYILSRVIGERGSAAISSEQSLSSVFICSAIHFLNRFQDSIKKIKSITSNISLLILLVHFKVYI